MAKILILEALNADFGDCLLLHYGDEADPRRILIDGGPKGVYKNVLAGRLKALLAERNATVADLLPGTPLPLRLILVSHIDGDHITGILDLLNDSNYEALCRTTGIWHNSFNDIVAGTDDAQELTPTVTALVNAASSETDALADLWRNMADTDGRAQAIVADVKQGRSLRDIAKKKGIPLNDEFSGKLVQASPAIAPGGKIYNMGEEMTFRVLGPSAPRVRDLQIEWDKKLVALNLNQPEGGQANPAALVEAAAYLDKSIPNLSSIIVLAEFQGKRILLTGDARGDDILTGLYEAGKLDDEGKISVDLLKLPHHGSDRNLSTDFFRRVQAKHYVVSADGTYGNPDTATLEMLSTTRLDDDFTLYLTNVPDHVQKFLDKEKMANRKYRVEWRQMEESSIAISLL